MEYELPTQEIIKLSDLVREKELTIPSYQRPYKWKSGHVVQLLEDIFENVIQNKKVYRIGSVILYREGSKKNIVDGQQRLTTISILLKCLDSNFSGLLLNQNFKHKISKDNIVYNKRTIDNWLSKKPDKDKKNFKTIILEKCEFVLFTVYKQDEAFQLFDSQNSRGQSLKPYDLLKAFHLREMEFDTEEAKAICVQRWEKSIDEEKLKPILGNHLFRIRKWSKNENKYDFTKEEINEFKGISLYKKQVYPYERSLRMLDGLVENAQKDKLLKNLDIAQTFPFSITMPIINGKRFFEYVDYYISLKDNLFGNQPDFVSFYKKNCLFYQGARRSGDEKVRNLYENIILSFIDKFGVDEVKDFNAYYKAFYKVVYLIRCNNKSIRMETILNSGVKKIVKEIDDAVMPEQLTKYQFKTNEITTTDFVKGIECIINFIKE
jgi:hypothetical protein